MLLSYMLGTKTSNHNTFSGETDFNECESTPCQNNGECIDLIGRYQCRCSGFEGANCKFSKL